MQKITRWLSEYALAEKGAIPGEVLDQRINALRDLGNNYDQMNGAQFKEAMTTAHFASYFADAISRMFYRDYEYQVGSWTQYTTPDTTPDFRDVARFRMSEPGTLYQRGEKGEATATHISEVEVNYGVDEYARQFDVSWRTIMNDDLGKIQETPQRMVKAATNWLNGFVSALYDNATTQAGLVALGATYAGTGRLTAANLAIGLNAMRQRVDGNGNLIQINRVHLVIPPILQIQAADILEDLLSYGGPGGNVLGRFVAGVHVDPYITWAGINVPWYLFADPNEITTVPVARLQGWPGPIAAMKRSNIELVTGSTPAAFLMGSFETGDIEFLVQDVIGGWDDTTYVGVVDVNGIYYSSGTTP